MILKFATDYAQYKFKQYLFPKDNTIYVIK